MASVGLEGLANGFGQARLLIIHSFAYYYPLIFPFIVTALWVKSSLGPGLRVLFGQDRPGDEDHVAFPWTHFRIALYIAHTYSYIAACTFTSFGARNCA